MNPGTVVYRVERDPTAELGAELFVREFVVTRVTPHNVMVQSLGRRKLAGKPLGREIPTNKQLFPARFFSSIAAACTAEILVLTREIRLAERTIAEKRAELEQLDELRQREGA